MDKSALVAAMRMPPEKAVAYLREKGLQVSESWRDIWAKAHQKAFTVAQSAGFDVLADIRQALVDALNEGQTYSQFVERLKPVLQAKGWWGQAIDPITGEILKTYPDSSRPVEWGSPRRLSLIYAQNIQTAFMVGRYQGMKAATDSHPYWQYVAVLDTRTRPTHRAMHGRVFRHDDVAWSVAYPPNGWRCRCRARPLTDRSLKAEGLSVESAAGYIQDVQVPQRSGPPIGVKRLNLPGLEKPFQPDVGFDHNPAEGWGG